MIDADRRSRKANCAAAPKKSKREVDRLGRPERSIFLDQLERHHPSNAWVGSSNPFRTGLPRLLNTRDSNTHDGMPSSTKRTIDELAAAAEAEYRRLEPRILLLKDAVAEEKALTKRLKMELSAMRVALAEARGTTATALSLIHI